jgi:hypothetical protein
MDYLAALLAGVEGLRPRLPAISEAADQVAGRLAADGRLLLASMRPDFTSEGFVRSGGLMLAEEWRPQTRLSPNDAVILGWSGAPPDQELELLRDLRASGALIVGLGPTSWAGADSQLGADLFLESSLPLPRTATAPFGGEDYPLISLQNLVVLWTFTGEIVAALTRIGQMPAMYQSVLVAGARDRNAQFADSRFHHMHQVPAIPPGQVGGEYLDAIGEILRALIEEEARAIERVGAVCAQVLNNGRIIHAGMISHFPVHQHGAPGDPLYMRRLGALDGESPSVAELERELQLGDLFFFLGYYRRPTQAYQVARRAGARIVEVITGDGLDGQPPPDYVIRPKWPFGDAVTRVPGYDVEILPSSGIVQAAIYWAVVASIWQELAERSASTRIL